jgi:AbiV family abortive infection protein
MKTKNSNMGLSIQKAAEGIEIIKQNSKSLLEEAELLYLNEKFARSFSLSILSIEEACKVPMIRMILIEDRSEKRNEYWKMFRSHSEKNWGLRYTKFTKESLMKFEKINLFFNNEKTISAEFDRLKQLSIYSDFGNNNDWSSPLIFIDKSIAESGISVAKTFQAEKLSILTTMPELELWVKFMKPVLKVDSQKVEEALINCITEARKLGVLSVDINPADINLFANIL